MHEWVCSCFFLFFPCTHIPSFCASVVQKTLIYLELKVEWTWTKIPTEDCVQIWSMATPFTSIAQTSHTFHPKYWDANCKPQWSEKMMVSVSPHVFFQWEKEHPKKRLGLTWHAYFEVFLTFDQLREEFKTYRPSWYTFHNLYILILKFKADKFESLIVSSQSPKVGPFLQLNVVSHTTNRMIMFHNHTRDT